MGITVFILAVIWSSSAIHVRHVSDSSEMEQLRLKANTDENIAKIYGKYYGQPVPRGNRPERLNDGKFETSELYNLRDTKGYDASYLRFDAVMNITKLYFVYMYNATNVFEFQSFNIYVSLETWKGGERENMAKNILVAKKVAFENQYDIIEVDFGAGGVLTRSIGFLNYDKFDPKKSFTKELLVSEVMAFGSVHRRILWDNPAETPLGERSPMPDEFKKKLKSQLFNTIVPSFWRNLSNPTMSYSMKWFTRTLVPTGEFQACAFDCDGRCNTIVGLVPGVTNEIRYGVTTHHELMLAWDKPDTNEFLKALYDWLCPGCKPEKPTTIPTSKKDNTLIILDQSVNLKLFTGQKQKVIDLMKSGQVVLILTYESKKQNQLYRDPDLEEIFAWLGVWYSMTINQPWKGKCYLKESIAPLIISTKHIPFYFFGIGIPYNDPAKIALPGVYEETADGKKLASPDENLLDYVIYMRRPRTGNYYQLITDEQTRWLLYWTRFYGTENPATVSKKSSFPGIGNYPGMPRPDSRRDAVVIKFAANSFNRIASGQLGAASGVPWTYRMLEGTLGGWTICQIGRSDRTKVSFRRIRQPNDFCFKMDLPLKDIRWPYTRGFGAMPEGGDFKEKLAGYPMIYKPRTMVASFSGVFRLAAFLYKHPRWREIWERTRMRTAMSVFEMTGDRVSQHMRLESAFPQTPENLYLTLQLFDKWVKANSNYQYGVDYSPWSGRGQYINYDIQISVGFMHSGYPVQAFFGSEQVNGEFIQNNGSWGICHEFGHNMVTGAATLPGFTEVSNNVLCWLDYNVTGIRNRLGYEPGARFFSMDSLVQQWLTHKLWYDYRAQILLYGYIGWKFGMAANGNAWTLLRTTTTYNNFGKEDRLCWATSKSIGVDMAPYLLFVGLNISPAMVNITATISPKCWMPEGDEWAERQEVVAEIARFLPTIGRQNCTAKSAELKVKPVVPFDRYFNVMDPTLDSEVVETRVSPYYLTQAK